MSQKCPKCGYLLELNQEECPKCGLILKKYNPLKEKHKNNITDQNRISKIANFLKKKKTTIFFFLSLSFFLFSIIYIYVDTHSENFSKTNNRKKETSINKTQSINSKNVFQKIFNHVSKKDYFIKIKQITVLMSNSKNRCLLICNNYSSVWQNAINNQWNFNYELSNFRKKLSDAGIFNDLKNDKQEIEKQIKSLNEYSHYNETIFNKLVELYGVYSQILDLSITPQGSLLTFNSTINNLDSKYTRIYNELNVMLPNYVEDKNDF